MRVCSFVVVKEDMCESVYAEGNGADDGSRNGGSMMGETWQVHVCVCVRVRVRASSGVLKWT